jgi:hypothetical protein
MAAKDGFPDIIGKCWGPILLIHKYSPRDGAVGTAVSQLTTYLRSVWIQLP